MLFRSLDARLRSSVPPQLGPTLPKLHATSEADLLSGPRTTPILESHSGVKREGESGSLGEQPYFKRRREEDACVFRSSSEARSLGGRSPDRLSQRSGTASVKSVKRGEQDDPQQSQASNGLATSTA